MRDRAAVEYLTVEDVLGICDALGLEVADVGLLDAAVARPRSAVFGADVYPSIEEKAAALLHSLVTHRAVAAGHERVAFAATDVFLRVNGRRPTAPDADLAALVADVAAGDLLPAPLTDIARRLQIGPA